MSQPASRTVWGNAEWMLERWQQAAQARVLNLILVLGQRDRVFSTRRRWVPQEAFPQAWPREAGWRWSPSKQAQADLGHACPGNALGKLRPSPNLGTLGSCLSETSKLEVSGGLGFLLQSYRSSRGLSYHC